MTRAQALAAVAPASVTGIALLVQWACPPYGEAATMISLAVLLGWCFVLLRRARRIYAEAMADLATARAAAAALRDLPPPPWLIDTRHTGTPS